MRKAIRWLPACAPAAIVGLLLAAPGGALAQDTWWNGEPDYDDPPYYQNDAYYDDGYIGNDDWFYDEYASNRYDNGMLDDDYYDDYSNYYDDADEEGLFDW